MFTAWWRIEFSLPGIAYKTFIYDKDTRNSSATKALPYSTLLHAAVSGVFSGVSLQ